MKKKSPLRLVRIIVASIVFAAFVLMFLNIGGIFSKVLSPVAKLQFWPAVMAGSVGLVLLLLVITMVFGRVYCSFLCPLGIMQDGIYRLKTLGKTSRRYEQKWTKPHNILRYSILAAFIALLCFGLGSYAYLIEPYSIFGRMISSVTVTGLTIMLISAATLAVITFLVIKGGRTWCNTICPVGSILSIASRQSIFSPTIDTEKCVGCGLCGKACRADCIDTANHRIDTSRCIVCFDCLENCSVGAISFSLHSSFIGSHNRQAPSYKEYRKKDAEKAKEKENKINEAQDNGRRAFLTATALALGTAALKAEEGHGSLGLLVKKVPPERVTPIVPPGAASVEQFSKLCISCQLCVQACPSGVLHPGLDSKHFMMPTIDYDKGFCRSECTVCSEVCPAGAIVRISPEEKTAISIGHAVYNPQLCVVRTDSVQCGNCAAHCPAGAISMVRIPGAEEDSPLRIPSINPERCIGCGHCEYVCPGKPVSAIYVEGNEVHRKI